VSTLTRIDWLEILSPSLTTLSCSTTLRFAGDLAAAPCLSAAAGVADAGSAV